VKTAGLAILALVAITLLGEVALILGYIGLSIFAWVWFKRRWISASVTVMCLAALVLHSLGFKLYGRAVVATDRESLTRPRQAVALEPPSKVVFKDGSAIHLPDIFFPKVMDLLEGTTNNHGVFQDRFRIHAQLGHDQYHQEWIDVEVEKSSANVSKAVCLRKANYWCGNTWFPTFFPSRLPKQLREDFGVMLVRAGVALPTVEYVTSASQYHDPLVQALHSGYFLGLPAQHPDVVRLGRLLVESRPEEFETGANLLMQVEDVASYPMLLAEIKKRRGNKPLSIHDLESSSSYAGFLIRLDVTEAEKLMVEFRTQKEPHPFWATETAGLLARNGDFSGFDSLVLVLAKTDLNAEYRKSLGTQLTLRFRFLRGFDLGWGMPEGVSMLFPEWYAENRQSLRWSKLPDGGTGFALTSSGIFDEAYFKTMEKYLAKANSSVTQ
jgi:hypothetical protein